MKKYILIMFFLFFSLPSFSDEGNYSYQWGSFVVNANDNHAKDLFGNQIIRFDIKKKNGSPNVELSALDLDNNKYFDASSQIENIKIDSDGELSFTFLDYNGCGVSEDDILLCIEVKQNDKKESDKGLNANIIIFKLPLLRL